MASISMRLSLLSAASSWFCVGDNVGWEPGAAHKKEQTPAAGMGVQDHGLGPPDPRLQRSHPGLSKVKPSLVMVTSTGALVNVLQYYPLSVSSEGYRETS